MKFICSIVASLLFSSAARAVVIYQDIEDVNIFSQMQMETDFDINSDGTNDLVFSHNQGDFFVIGAGNNRIIATAATPPDLGADVIPLMEGVNIDFSLPSSLAWWAPETNGGHGHFISCRTIGCLGLWSGGVTAFTGVEFEIEGSVHYGWLEINVPGLGGWGIIKSLAWEDEPNKAIEAGVVPEPSSTVMLSLGVIVLFCRRRR